jgi:hypothetical protein
MKINNYIMNRVLSFSNYHKLNEAEVVNKSASAAEQIVDLFFQAYGALVTKIGDYKDAISDLLDVAEEKDASKKGEVMDNVLRKVISKIDPTYKEVGGDITQAAKNIKEVYATLLDTEEGKKSLEEINKAIYRKIIEKQKGLETSAKELKPAEAKEIKESINLEDSAADSLFEKNTFVDERNALISKIKPFYAESVQQAKNAISANLKSKSVETAKSLKTMYELLSDEAKWDSMKRSTRKSELERINSEMDKLNSDMNEVRKSELLKIGIDKKVSDGISGIIELINSAIGKISAIDSKKIETEQLVKDDKKDDAAKDDKKDDASKDEEKPVEIASGNVDKKNLTKKGPNLDKIKSFQEKYNTLFPSENIKADGLYGKNTEQSVVKVAKLIGGLIGEDLAKATEDGKKLTPELQSAINKFNSNKDKIKELISK